MPLTQLRGLRNHANEESAESTARPLGTSAARLRIAFAATFDSLSFDTRPATYFGVTYG